MEKFREIRRRDRILDQARIDELLETGEYGFLSLGEGDNGYPYGIPISYAWDPGEKLIHLHCAPEGHKLDILARNPRVSFCIVGRTQPQGEKFTTIYESVIAFGTASVAGDNTQRIKSLRALVRKYSPGFEQTGETYIGKSLHRTQTITITVERITGKCKK